jgi:Bifunctional DNA primase/polymerase, N-terminal
MTSLNSPLDVALDYIRRGWNPLPVTFRGKEPQGDTGWQTRIIDAASAPRFFNANPLNIGVLLGPTSHGLTDVDLDCAEAIAIAPYILPPTGAIFGRASKHRIGSMPAT